MTPENAATDNSAVEAAKERYGVERDKRIRAEGKSQYSELSGQFEEFNRDPYVEPGFTRDAQVEEVDVVIVGGGFGGMLEAANLRKLGINSFRIIEKGGDFGGTWYWNRYPGAMCDVESYVYLPMLEETGYMPTKKYAQAPEIFAYCQLLGRRFDLYENALFQTEVEDMAWDESAERWVTSTTRDDVITSKFIVIAGGVLHKAKLPGIPGIENYEGRGFHTSRWDYDYTGGSPSEFMDKLAGKRVGIIGTGATAVQVVPRVAEAAGELFVFQRTPAFVGFRGQGPTDEEWFKSQKPGWQDERIKNFTRAVCGEQPDENLVGDEWTNVMWTDITKVPDSPEEGADLERIDFELMEGVRNRIASIVTDPDTAAKLQPWYGVRCKRPCFHDEYLPAFNRENVHLIDTNGQGVERITKNGPVVDGVEYPVDMLIYASGFEVAPTYDRLGFDPKGRGGVAMTQSWGEGPHTMHGVMSRDFPNLLMISTTQGGFGVNFVHYLTEVSKHCALVIKMCLDGGIAEIEPTAGAEEDWFMVLMGKVVGTGAYNATCTPGYLNAEQQAGDMKAARAASFMGSVEDYANHLNRWREEGELVGVDIVRVGQS
jgi:cation diffusion facilitator CzcD-associated flavoprotein CzcO